MPLPPGPRTPGVYELVRWMLSPAGSFEDSFRVWGDLYTINNPIYGKEVVVSHPDLIRQIMTGPPEVFHGGEANLALSVVVGDSSVLLLDGAAHHRQRKLLMPPFHGERMGLYADVIARTTHAVAGTFPASGAFAILPYMQRITFDVILEAVFGLTEGDRLDRVRTHLLDLVETAQSPIGMLLLMPGFRRTFGAIAGWRKVKKAIDAADVVLHEIIAEARASRARGQDVLSLLLSAVDEEGNPMTDAELRDELMTLLLAGHETTATALAWAVEEILRRPEVLERINAEVSASTGPSSPMPYLDATFKEVLRLHPIAPLLVRKTKATVTLRDYEIPPDIHLVLNAYTAGRHPDFWDAPDRFLPERFLDKKPDAYAWLPFGGGARRCIGMAFALFEAKIILAEVLGRSLRLAGPPAKVALRGFMFAPSGGTRVTVS